MFRWIIKTEICRGGLAQTGKIAMSEEDAMDGRRKIKPCLNGVSKKGLGIIALST